MQFCKLVLLQRRHPLSTYVSNGERELWKCLSNGYALMLIQWVHTHVGRGGGLEIDFFAYVLNECRQANFILFKLSKNTLKFSEFLAYAYIHLYKEFIWILFVINYSKVMFPLTLKVKVPYLWVTKGAFLIYTLGVVQLVHTQKKSILRPLFLLYASFNMRKDRNEWPLPPPWMRTY
jgi:hypothetical protein